MGWDFGQGDTKADVIRNRTQPWVTREGIRHMCIQYAIVGDGRQSVLWTVWETKRERYIVCVLLKNNPGFGWGYKCICEASHPYYYSCPLSFLLLAPVQSTEWRAKVREWHGI